jgi:chemotaxis protein methyltransferase CheR
VSEPFVLSPADLERVEAILKAACGFSLSKALRRAVQDSFQRGAQSLGMGGSEFLERLCSGEAESISCLVEHSVIGETYFFRHPEQFAALRRLLGERREECPLSVWSAGCASGEEPYTMAILLKELGLTGRIVASDISERALQQAVDRHVTGDFLRFG